MGAANLDSGAPHRALTPAGQTRFAVCPIRLTASQAARPSGGRRRLWRESTPPFGGVASPPPHWWLALWAAAARLAKCPYRTASGAPLRGPSGTFRGELAGVVTSTVFTVGSMQGGTPRKAGCVRCGYAHVNKGSGRGATSHVFGVWSGYACPHGSLTPSPSAFPCTPRMRGATLHQAHGEKPWGHPRVRINSRNAAEWRCGFTPIIAYPFRPPVDSFERRAI